MYEEQDREETSGRGEGGQKPWLRNWHAFLQKLGLRCVDDIEFVLLRKLVVRELTLV